MKIIYCSLLIAISLPLFAGTKTFIREYTYTAGEADSKITSRAIALDQVKRILLEEIGVYLQSEMSTIKEEKNNVYNELTKQQIQSITAGITETKIVEEKWNGEKYYIKASISVDPDEVNKNIARIGADQSKLKELVDVKRKADDAFAEIERLRKELATTKSVKDKLTKQTEYNTASNTLSEADWIQKGYNSYEVKEYDNAILYLQKAIELNPQSSGVYYNMGLVYSDKGNIDKAIQLYEKAIEQNPQDYRAYINLGLVYSQKGNLDKAIQLYEKAIELNPQNSIAYQNMGQVYSDKGNLDKTIQLYEKAIELNPQDSITYYNLALTYSDKGNLDKAIQLYEKAIELNPKYFYAYYNLAIIYYEKGNIDKTIQLNEKAIELNPRSSEVYGNLGVAYGRKGNLDKAIQLNEKAIELNPQNSEGYRNLGTAYSKKGILDKAIQFYQKAAKLGNEYAQQWLNKKGYTW